MWREYSSAFVAEDQHFANVVQGLTEPLETGEGGKAVLEIIFAVNSERGALPTKRGQTRMGTRRPVVRWLSGLREAAQTALGLRRQTDPEGFEKLIVQLRAEGHAEMADRLDDLLHHTAWTTGSELNGVLGLTIRSFQRSRPTLSRSLRQALNTCLRTTKPPWSALG